MVFILSNFFFYFGESKLTFFPFLSSTVGVTGSKIILKSVFSSIGLYKDIYYGGRCNTGHHISTGFDFFFYINLISLVVFVGTVKNASIKLLSMKLNKVLGDLAYPIFLTHWIVGYVVSQWILEGERRGLTLFAVSLFPILVVSYALSECATRLIEPLRSKVRNGVKSYHYPRVLMPSRSNTVVERDAPQAARPLP